MVGDYVQSTEGRDKRPKGLVITHPEAIIMTAMSLSKDERERFSNSVPLNNTNEVVI